MTNPPTEVWDISQKGACRVHARQTLLERASADLGVWVAVLEASCSLPVSKQTVSVCPRILWPQWMLCLMKKSATHLLRAPLRATGGVSKKFCPARESMNYSHCYWQQTTGHTGLMTALLGHAIWLCLHDAMRLVPRSSMHTSPAVVLQQYCPIPVLCCIHWWTICCAPELSFWQESPPPLRKHGLV